MEYLEFYQNFINLERAGRDEYRGICPFHHDTKPSFYVNAPTGKWFCQGACKEGGHVIEFIQKYNRVSRIEAIRFIKENYPGLLPPGKESKKEYVYCDRKGRAIYKVIKESERKFPVFVKKGNEWVPSGGDLEKIAVPYNLHRFSESPEIWVTEGEKDAETISSMGYVATTFQGANWYDKYARFFTNKHVVIIGDNDEEGEKFVQKVIEGMSNMCKSIRQVKVPSPYKDITEWTENEGFAKVKEEIETKLSKDVVLRVKMGTVKRTHLRRNSNRRFIIPDLIPAGTVAVIAGDPKIGKSNMALRLADQAGSSLYIYLEGGEEEMAIKAERLNLKSEIIFDFPPVMDYNLPKYVQEKINDVWFEWRKEVKLIVVDSISATEMADREKGLREILTMYRAFQEVVKDKAIIMISHLRKNKNVDPKAPTIQDVYGSLGITAGADLILLVTKYEEDKRRVKIYGRNVVTRTITISDPYKEWKILEGLTVRDKILSYIEIGPATASQIAQETGESYEYVRKVLRDLEKAKKIRRKGRYYCL